MKRLALITTALAFLLSLPSPATAAPSKRVYAVCGTSEAKVFKFKPSSCHIDIPQTEDASFRGVRWARWPSASADNRVAVGYGRIAGKRFKVTMSRPILSFCGPSKWYFTKVTFRYPDGSFSMAPFQKCEETALTRKWGDALTASLDTDSGERMTRALCLANPDGIWRCYGGYVDAAGCEYSAQGHMTRGEYEPRITKVTRADC